MRQQEFRMNYVKKIWTSYQQVSRTDKSRMLDEFCRVCGYQRKYAIRLLNAPLREKRSVHARQGRWLYSSRTISILEDLWKTAGYPWSVRLKKIIQDWKPWIRKHYGLDLQTEAELEGISARQIDRRLAPKRRKIQKKIYGTTKPGSLLKQQIPIRTKNWDITQAGYLEIDTVAHGGNSVAGEFVYTLNCVDIQTTWVERQAVMGKGEQGVLAAFIELQQAFPFCIRGIDSDNGGEFINYHLYRYCQRSRPRIAFNRGRPYEPKDSAHIEEKNWTHVRKILGWDRYESPDALEALKDLYQNELRWWHNFFQPSVKLLRKVQRGSRWIRQYNTPKTPFQRVLESPQADPRKVAQLQKLFHSLNPFELARQIEQKLEKIYTLAAHKGNVFSLPQTFPKKQPLPKTYPQIPSYPQKEKVYHFFY